MLFLTLQHMSDTLLMKGWVLLGLKKVTDSKTKSVKSHQNYIWRGGGIKLIKLVHKFLEIPKLHTPRCGLQLSAAAP